MCCWGGVRYVLLNIVLEYTEHKIYQFYHFTRGPVHKIRARVGSLGLAGDQGQSGPSCCQLGLAFPGSRLLARAFLCSSPPPVVSIRHSKRSNFWSPG